ncbi:MAG: transporter substrate-binding domain-containing protein [Kordiimonadaceae bacterium]|nr:transporter substrate-binding domain-containing protein [Kordiimonadaceae bacterium]
MLAPSQYMRLYFYIFVILFPLALAPAGANEPVERKRVFGNSAGITLKAAVPWIGPFGFMEDGKIEGSQVEFYKALAALTGYNIEVSLVNYKRVQFLLKSGYFDLAMIFKAPHLNEFSTPIIELEALPNIIIGLQGTEIKSLKALETMTVAALRGGVFDQMFSTHKNWQSITANSYEHSVRLLLKGRVDAMVGTLDGVIFHLQRAGVTPDMLGSPFELDTQEMTLYASHASKLNGDYEIMKAATQQMQKDGLTERIRQSFLDPAMRKKLRLPAWTVEN